MTNKDIDDIKNKIDELVNMLKDKECENRKLKSENDELRKRIEKLESGICGGSPCIVSEFHLFEGESWIRAITYDDVLLRLKKANERISELEQERLNQGLNSFKGIEAMRKLNDELKAENKELKQQIKDLEDACDQSCFSDYEPQLAEDDDISLFNYECIKRWTSESKLKKKIAELQDQHQHDCIRYTDMRIAYLVTLDELEKLREQFGVGR